MSAGCTRAVLGAEWIKLRSVPSTLWTLLLAFISSVGIALMFGLVLRGAYDDIRPESKASFDPVGSGFNGLRLGMIALVVFGVLTVTSEYSSGTIRASLAAVPRRGLFYRAGCRAVPARRGRRARAAAGPTRGRGPRAVDRAARPVAMDRGRGLRRSRLAVPPGCLMPAHEKEGRQ